MKLARLLPVLLLLFAFAAPVLAGQQCQCGQNCDCDDCQCALEPVALTAGTRLCQISPKITPDEVRLAKLEQRLDKLEKQLAKLLKAKKKPATPTYFYPSFSPCGPGGCGTGGCSGGSCGRGTHRR